MIDFEIMERLLQVARIKRFAENSDASWKIIPNQAIIQHWGLELLTICVYDSNQTGQVREPPWLLLNGVKSLAES